MKVSLEGLRPVIEEPVEIAPGMTAYPLNIMEAARRFLSATTPDQRSAAGSFYLEVVDLETRLTMRAILERINSAPLRKIGHV